MEEWFMIASDALITIDVISWPLVKIKLYLKYVTTQEIANFNVFCNEFREIF